MVEDNRDWRIRELEAALEEARSHGAAQRDLVRSDPVESIAPHRAAPDIATMDPTREEVDSKIAAAEARTDTKFAELIGRVDAGFAELRGEMKAMRAEIAPLQGLRATIIITSVTLFLGLGALVVGLTQVMSAQIGNVIMAFGLGQASHQANPLTPPKP